MCLGLAAVVVAAARGSCQQLQLLYISVADSALHPPPPPHTPSPSPPPLPPGAACHGPYDGPSHAAYDGSTHARPRSPRPRRPCSACARPRSSPRARRRCCAGWALRGGCRGGVVTHVRWVGCVGGDGAGSGRRGVLVGMEQGLEEEGCVSGWRGGRRERGSCVGIGKGSVWCWV
jgi:hypothetical protein